METNDPEIGGGGDSADGRERHQGGHQDSVQTVKERPTGNKKNNEGNKDNADSKDRKDKKEQTVSIRQLSASEFKM